MALNQLRVRWTELSAMELDRGFIRAISVATPFIIFSASLSKRTSIFNRFEKKWRLTRQGQLHEFFDIIGGHLISLQVFIHIKSKKLSGSKVQPRLFGLMREKII